MQRNKMKNLSVIVCCVSLITILLVSCKKDDSVKIAHGNITLKVLVKHHDWTIHYLNVYLVSNTTEWPGTDSTLYDSMTQTSQNGRCEFTNLYPGNYYLYASGYDPVVNTNVIGYMPVQITSGLTDNTKDVTLYVSE